MGTATATGARASSPAGLLRIRVRWYGLQHGRSRNPGATEVVADGVDSDCDGNETCYVDADDDGYRPDTTTTVLSRTVTTRRSPLDGSLADCDDTDPTLNPGETDAVGDGMIRTATGPRPATPTPMTMGTPTARARPSRPRMATAATVGRRSPVLPRRTATTAKPRSTRARTRSATTASTMTAMLRPPARSRTARSRMPT